MIFRNFSFCFFIINSSLLFLIICFAIDQTSSIPLYYGEYAGVNAYRNPNSSILSLECLLLCTDRLSITSIISSNGYRRLNSSKNVLNLGILIEFLYTYTKSIPYSLETAAIIASGCVLDSLMSTSAFVLGRVHECVGIVLFVTTHSSNYTIRNCQSCAS